MDKDTLVISGAIVVVDLDGVMNIPAVYIKRRGPNNHMVCIGQDKLLSVTDRQIKFNESVTHDDQIRLHAAAKPYKRKEFYFVGYH